MDEQNPYAPPAVEQCLAAPTHQAEFVMDRELYLRAWAAVRSVQGVGYVLTSLLSVGLIMVLFSLLFSLDLDLDWRDIGEVTLWFLVCGMLLAIVGAAYLPAFLRYQLVVLPRARLELSQREHVLAWGRWHIDFTPEEVRLTMPSGKLSWKWSQIEPIEVQFHFGRLKNGLLLKAGELVLPIPRDALLDVSWNELRAAVAARCDFASLE